MAKTIGTKYRLDREIGVGGMGTVYLGTDIEFNDTVAIKHMKVDPSQDFDDTVHSFMTEARSYRALAHAHIVKYLDFVRQKVKGNNDDLYLVTEFIKGKSLEAVITEMRQMGIFFEETRAKGIIIQVLEALDYAHSEGVIHRDLKPSNVMFDESDDPQTHRPRVDFAKVIDFGIAKQGGVGNKTIGLAAIAFSPYFSSPEQAAGSDLTSAASDIYSVGVMLYEMLTGRAHLDFPQRPGIRILPGQKDEVPAKIMASTISPAMKVIICKATDPFASGRYKSAAEMRLALNPGLSSVRSGQSPAPNAPPPITTFTTTTRRGNFGIKPKDTK